MTTVCMSEELVRSHGLVREVMGKEVFFVVGCQKSGTTWVQEILNGHVCAGCWGEGRFVRLLIDPIWRMMEVYNSGHKAVSAAGIGRDTSMTKEDFLCIARTAVCLMIGKWAGQRLGQVTHVGDKSPEHVLNMPVLLELFPQAKFIHVIRDGRDGIVSGWHHNLTRGSAEFRQQFPTLADYAAYFGEHHWVRYIRAGQVFARVYPDRIHEMRYERLQEDPEGAVKGVLEFLGLSAEQADVQRCVAAGSFSRLSGGRRQGQEDAGSHFRKGVVGEWREMFDSETKRRFEEVAGGVLRELGYES